MKHNNQLPNAHFHKDWKIRVKTWLDQAGAKKRRRNARVEKAARIAPRPTEALRPAVHCQTIKYNTRIRAGRGFTLDEVKAAGITAVYARSVGIAVDHRRKNRCEESLTLNKERILSYLARLIVFPKNAKAPKKGECSDAAALAAATQVSLPALMPISAINKAASAPEPSRKVTEAEKNTSAYATMRQAWSTKRYAGIRSKRAAEAAEAAAEKKK